MGTIQYFGADDSRFITTGWPVRPAHCGMRLHPMDDWPFLLSSHANVLLEGTDRAIDRVVTVLTPHLRNPIQTCPHWARHAMHAMPRDGTLILRDVEALNTHEQRNLLQWLDDAGAQVQLISVVSTPLFRLVLEGRFLDTLYYRLNILYITAADALSIGGAG